MQQRLTSADPARYPVDRQKKTFESINCATIDFANSSYSSGRRSWYSATSVTATTNRETGRIRRIRRTQNSASHGFPFCCSLRISRVIRDPEMTKNISTPTNPPGTPSPVWNRRTRATATVLYPSMSGRYPAALTSGARPIEVCEIHAIVRVASTLMRNTPSTHPENAGFSIQAKATDERGCGELFV
jgi:hypothetical protein